MANSSKALVRVDLAFDKMVEEYFEELVSEDEIEEGQMELLQLVAFEGSDTEDSQSPLQCEPLAMVNPSVAMVLVLVGEPTNRGLEPLKWVKQKYHGFCKLVAFPIGSHDAWP
jgi:hypothetical protein